MPGARVRQLARECGFELAGVARAEPSPDFPRYQDWVDRGLAGEMRYLTDRRASIRADPRNLLPSARSVICVGKLYNTPMAYSTEFDDVELGWISRYAWGQDYHEVLRRGLLDLARHLGPDHQCKVCVDTVPLLERSYARQAGLGWIGKNTCLINEPAGSWFFLGELITSIEIEPDSPPPDRCGTCTRRIEACPTQAIAPEGYEVDSRLCISYFTIELHGTIPAEHRAAVGQNVFGCDICQDVCPWNGKAPQTEFPDFVARHATPPLDRMAALSENAFRDLFRGSPVTRARHRGFLRNVAVAMGNSGNAKFRPALQRLAMQADELVAEHARWALAQLGCGIV